MVLVPAAYVTRTYDDAPIPTSTTVRPWSTITGLTSTPTPSTSGRPASTTTRTLPAADPFRVAWPRRIGYGAMNEEVLAGSGQVIFARLAD